MTIVWREHVNKLSIIFGRIAIVLFLLVLQINGFAGQRTEGASLMAPPSGISQVRSGDMGPRELHSAFSEDLLIAEELARIYEDPVFAAKKVSLTMHDVAFNDVVQALGRAVEIQFVVDPVFKEKIDTIQLKDYSVGKALALVCKKIKPEAAVLKLNGVWSIIPHQEAIDKIKSQRSKEQVTQVIPMNYANLDETLQKKLESQWTRIVKDDKAASLNIDSEQKKIYVHGRRDYLNEFYAYLKDVDRPILQVRIDVIIVLARKDFFYDFGFDWSGIYNREQTVRSSGKGFDFYGVGGSPLDFPSAQFVNDYTVSSPTRVVPSPPNTNNPNLFVDPLNFALNLFNSGTAFYTKQLVDRISPGAIRIPFIFGGPDLNLRRLNVILNMAEVEEKLSIISRPSILTSNNKVAKILIGQSIPLQTTTEDVTATTTRSFITVNYKDTGIVLEVRPLVNPDKKSVYLNVLVEESIVESGDTRVNERGVMLNPPVISVIKTKNEIVLKNGQTTIIGGLSSKQTISNKRQVPFFAHLPIIGTLFRATHDSNQERERYIFITPRIIEYET